MDSFFEYMQKDSKSISIIINSDSGKDLIEKIKESDAIDVDTDCELIISNIRMQKPDLLLEFMQELENDGKTNLIIENTDSIGIQNIFRFMNIAKSSEFNEYVYKNLENLLNTEHLIDIHEIEAFILNGKDREEVRQNIPLIIRRANISERKQIIEIIRNNKELGNVEDYLSDFLYVPEENKIGGIEYILSALEELKDLDKTKLLQAVNENINSLVGNLEMYTDIRLKRLLDTIKRIEDKTKDESNKSEKLINKVNNSISVNFEKILEKFNYDVDLINSLRQFNIDNSKFRNLQDDIIKNLSEADLVIYIQSAKGNEGFDKNWDVSELTRQLFKNNKEVTNDEILQQMIAKLIEELCTHENLEIEDIKYGGSGFYSFNIKIGDYILKLGDDRRTEYIPNDKRIIKPLLRQQTNIENKKDVPNMFLEIQNVVDTSWYYDLEENEIKEQLYIIYKELRDRGIIWTDIKPQNVGKLLKPNKENFEIKVLNENGEIEKKELQSSNYAVSAIGDMPDEILNIGELVIIDTDYIYRKDQNKYKSPKGSYYEEFEKRYNKEPKFKIDDIKQIIKDGEYSRVDLSKIQLEINKAKQNSTALDR